jgi:hypothetical protein
MLRFLFQIMMSLLLLSGCGYRFGQGGIANRYATISVPYVTGDVDGSLTAAIIKQLSTSSSLEYATCGGQLTLQVILLDIHDENIGFRYDRHKKDNELKKDIIPTETRLRALVQVSVIEAASGEILMGPVKIASSVDFDHDYYSSRNQVNVFSLGQLSDVDEARDAVHIPLNEALAQKIVDYVNDSW